jgi:RHS repeat-associated protein
MRASRHALDANGNTLSDASGRSYTWDFENRLTQAVVPGQNGGTTTFKYDPFGRRIQKSGPLGSMNYLYSGPNLVEEVDQIGNLITRFTSGMSVDEQLSEFSSGTASYYEADGLGSTTSLTSPAGALSNTYTYDSYGKLTASTGTLANPFQYAAREADAETGLYYYRARYYDQNIGRFISEDPVQFRGGIDFYTYVSSNPVNFIDPSGLKACCNKPCMVDVRCWPIQKYNLGALGFKHCFVTVRTKDCELRDISGGPDNGRLAEWDTPAAPQPTAVTYQHSLVPCGMVDCMRAMAPAITNMNLPYHAGYQNSNSAFATILSACGLADLISYAPDGAVGSTPLRPPGGGGSAF